MDITKMLAELRANRELLDQAILTLERLARGGAPRRGRPPKWLSTQNAAQPKRRGRQRGTKMSPANRKAQSKRMKQYWAERKRKQKST